MGLLFLTGVFALGSESAADMTFLFVDVQKAADLLVECWADLPQTDGYVFMYR